MNVTIRSLEERAVVEEPPLVGALPPRRLLRVDEAATLLALGRASVYKLLDSGELPSVKIFGARRVAVVDLDAYVERLRATRPEPEPDGQP